MLDLLPKTKEQQKQLKQQCRDLVDVKTQVAILKQRLEAHTRAVDAVCTALNEQYQYELAQAKRVARVKMALNTLAGAMENDPRHHRPETSLWLIHWSLLLLLC